MHGFSDLFDSYRTSFVPQIVFSPTEKKQLNKELIDAMTDKLDELCEDEKWRREWYPQLVNYGKPRPFVYGQFEGDIGDQVVAHVNEYALANTFLESDDSNLSTSYCYFTDDNRVECYHSVDLKVKNIPVLIKSKITSMSFGLRGILAFELRFDEEGRLINTVPGIGRTDSGGVDLFLAMLRENVIKPSR